METRCVRACQRRVAVTCRVSPQTPDALPTALRAARLARADLATSTVTEMTALAGTMGRHYAAKGGEPQAVADAVFEAVLPRSAGDVLPTSRAGVLVSLADKYVANACADSHCDLVLIFGWDCARSI